MAENGCNREFIFMLMCSHFVINILSTVPWPGVGARSRSSEIISASCRSSANRLVCCNTVGESRGFKLKHFHTSLLCLPIIFVFPLKLWLQRFPALKSLSALKDERWEKCLVVPGTWALFRVEWKMEKKIQQDFLQQRGCLFKAKGFILWVGFPVGGGRRGILKIRSFLGRENSPYKLHIFK